MMTGTLEEVLSKLFDLYLENRMEDAPARRYLLLLRNPNNEHTFSEEDADRLLDMLREDKYEAENYVAGPKPKEMGEMVNYSKEKHWCIGCGEETYINTCGFCVGCWEKYAYLRANKRVEGKEEQGV
ncbi:hypothetical protein KAW18_16135 [candidate division WOR-3 bacterium]|nr:hypothetical protein [candidate division WOR-3 bacterium]